MSDRLSALCVYEREASKEEGRGEKRRKETGERDWKEVFSFSVMAEAVGRKCRGLELSYPTPPSLLDAQSKKQVLPCCLLSLPPSFFARSLCSFWK